MDSINFTLQQYPNGSESKLDLGEINGDDIVDHQSQFAIRFNYNNTDSYQKVKRTFMIVDSTNNYGNPLTQGPFHNGILKLGILYDKVWWYIND